MKVVYAATPEQETHIEELVEYIYGEIFPRYFTDEEIVKLESLNVLVHNDDNYNGTLKEAFQLISSLQALIAVVETVKEEEILLSHREIFEKNVKTLDEFGYSFPFNIEQFRAQKDELSISKFAKPTNLYLA
ncbi:YhcU family protein [Cytobacillus suaedae]|nr:YhcU family protein [Cytobacillus suaedae]